MAEGERKFEGLQIVLQSLVQTISACPLDELEELYKQSVESSRRWMSIGPIMDPTKYRDFINDGSVDSSNAQIEIVQAFITIRKQIDKIAAASTRYQQYHDEGE